MRKAEIAESILSLVMEPQRSVSAVGDLTEECGAVGFWISVARIFAGALWNPFRTNLAGMARLTAIGLVIELAAAVGVIAIAGVISAIVGYVEGTVWSTHPGAYMPAFSTAPVIITYIVGTFGDFQAGRWTAKVSPGREIAVCLATGVTWWLMQQIVLEALSLRFESSTGWRIIDFLPAVAFLAGAAMVRSRSLKGSATAS